MGEKITLKHRHFGIPLRVTFNEPVKSAPSPKWPTFVVLGNPNDFTIYHAVVTQAASLIARLI